MCVASSLGVVVLVVCNRDRNWKVREASERELTYQEEGVCVSGGICHFTFKQ